MEPAIIAITTIPFQTAPRKPYCLPTIKRKKNKKKRNAVLNKTLKIRDKTCQVLLTGIVESINNKPSQVRPGGIAGFNIHEAANNK